MHFSRWTLRSRLILLTTALVAATSIVIGGVVAFAIRGTLETNYDNQIASTAQALGRGGGGLGSGGQLPLEEGTVIVVYPSYGESEGGSVTNSNQIAEFSTKQLQALKTVVSADAVRQDAGRLVTGPVAALGEYRFVVDELPGGAVLVVGRPTSVIHADVAKALAPIAVIVFSAILLAGLLGALIVGRALRPLRRVAGVASNVASLPLARGDVDLPQRVPERDTNPHTEVGQVGAALNNLLDSVESALAVRQASEEKVRHFVADASHELRTPLASIRGYAELTRRFGGDLSTDVQHNIGRIESEAMRMTSLVEDLLLLARLDAERELETRDVDLSRLLVDVVGDAHAAGRDHEWDLELPEEPVVVRGDEAKLQQVFTNLLANARVHTPAGTRVTIELFAPRDGHVLAQVRDDGPGIPEQLRPQLFGRFVRGDSSRARTTGSTGLGLSIVSAVVHAHHGTVSVASEPGATVFTVQLPVEQPALTKSPQPA